MSAGRSATYPKVVELLKRRVSEIGQRAVARESGLSLKAIQRYLAGNSEPTQASLEKLSKYFNVSVAELRGEDAVVDLLRRLGNTVKGEHIDLITGTVYDPDIVIFIGHMAIRIANQFDGTLESVSDDIQKIKSWIDRLPKDEERLRRARIAFDESHS